LEPEVRIFYAAHGWVPLDVIHRAHEHLSECGSLTSEMPINPDPDVAETSNCPRNLKSEASRVNDNEWAWM